MDSRKSYFFIDEDSLIKPDTGYTDGHGFSNAPLHFQCDMSSAYIRGYKLAADHLVEMVTNDVCHGHDTFIYPILFLYRHYIELIMKKIISEASILLNLKIKQRYTHKISKVWHDCKMLILKIQKEMDDDTDYSKDFQIFENLIDEFEKLDSNSESFRYPEDKQGKKTLVKETKMNGNPKPYCIGYNNLYETMNRVSSFLESVYSHCDYYLSELYELMDNSSE